MYSFGSSCFLYQVKGKIFYNVYFQTYYNNNNNNNKLQLGCHPVAVVILHVYRI